MVEFSFYFLGYVMVKLVVNEVIICWIDFFNIVVNCDGSKVEVYLYLFVVIDEFYMFLYLRSVFSNLIVNSIGESNDKNVNCFKFDGNFDREGGEESFNCD